jgi:hypothetical protein
VKGWGTVQDDFLRVAEVQAKFLRKRCGEITGKIADCELLASASGEITMKLQCKVKKLQRHK